MLLAQGKDDDGIIEGLKLEVHTLKNRCNRYERMIKDLQSRCYTHQNALEMLLQKIVHCLDSQGTLSTMYHRKNYDMMP